METFKKIAAKAWEVIKKIWLWVVMALFAVALIVCIVLYAVNVDNRNSIVVGILVTSSVLILVLIGVLVWYKKNVVAERNEDMVCANQLFDILSNNSNEVFIMLSKENLSVDYVSPNVERVTGATVKQVKKSITHLGKAKYSSSDDVTYQTLDTLPIGASYSYETERVNSYTGEHRYFIETIYHIATEQGEKFIVTIADRTEELFNKQTMEEALSIAKVANKAKSAFLTNMSHDIRTPMNAIVGLCALLEKDADDGDKVREHLNQMSLTSRHMVEILNDVLDMSKMETGETKLDNSEVNLSEIIMEIDSIIRPQAKAKQQAFNIVTAVQEESFLGDKLRLKRIMLNILSNAVKYTPEGGRIDFTIRQMARATKKYVRLQFTVKDTGVGMSADFLKKVFEPFSRPKDDKSEGTGLGLPIAKNLVDLMGGTIAVESKEGAGSTFTVNIKFQLKEEEGAVSDFWAEHGVERVLAVGLPPEDRASVSDALDRTDLIVHFEESVKGALAHAADALKNGKSYDVVLVDWQSTESGRKALIGGLRKSLPAAAPIIAFGEHDWSDSERQALDGGIKCFLSKPFFLSAFKDCLQTKTGDTGSVESGKGLLKNMHFLAAEDNELNSMILTELLNTVGAECVVKRNGQELLEEFERSEEGRFDAILMDIQMPVMNGYEATKAIRACDHPQGKKIPIIAMTANAFAEDVQNSLNAGMNAHLSKPLDMNELERTIENLKTV